MTSYSSFVNKNTEVISTNNQVNNINSLKKNKKSNSLSIIIRKSISKILNKYTSNVVNENKNEKNNKDKDIKKPFFNKNDNNILQNILHNKEKKIKGIELYGQNFNLEYFRKNPPKAPELFDHIYNIQNINVFTKDNEALGSLNKDIIPNVFYNHMIYNRDNSINYNKCKYFKSCIVQRNKKKLSSIIYYFPCN